MGYKKAQIRTQERKKREIHFKQVKTRIPESLGTRVFIGIFNAPGGTRTPARRGLGTRLDALHPFLLTSIHFENPLILRHFLMEHRKRYDPFWGNARESRREKGEMSSSRFLRFIALTRKHGINGTRSRLL